MQWIKYFEITILLTIISLVTKVTLRAAAINKDVDLSLKNTEETKNRDTAELTPEDEENLVLLELLQTKYPRGSTKDVQILFMDTMDEYLDGFKETLMKVEEFDFKHNLDTRFLRRILDQDSTSTDDGEEIFNSEEYKNLESLAEGVGFDKESLRVLKDLRLQDLRSFIKSFLSGLVSGGNDVDQVLIQSNSPYQSSMFGRQNAQGGGPFKGFFSGGPMSPAEMLLLSQALKKSDGNKGNKLLKFFILLNHFGGPQEPLSTPSPSYFQQPPRHIHPNLNPNRQAQKRQSNV